MNNDIEYLVWFSINKLKDYIKEQGKKPSTKEWNEYADKNECMSTRALEKRLKRTWKSLCRNVTKI